MKPAHAETAIFTSLGAIFCAALLVFEDHYRELKLADGASLAATFANDEVVFVATMTLLGAAFALTVFHMLILRAQAREQTKLHTLTTVLRRRSKEMELAAFTDVLTGLHNRRYFDEALGQYLLEFGKIDRSIGLMILDLDHFKSINDTYGHDVGDEVLRAVSDCLRDFARYHDIVARMGGEEFAVVVPDMDEAAVSAFADRMRDAIQRLSLNVGNVRLRVTCSIGVALAQEGESSSSLYKRADINLYRAKDSGRNRICA